jgi:hypothetical protein
MKLSFTILAAVFGFALGIYFQHALPEPKREIASQKESFKGDVKVSAALKDCLSDRVKDGRLDVSKVEVDGRSWAILSIDCVGDRAKVLYESVAPYADEQYVRYSDGRRGVGRFFGKLYPPSQCVRLIRNARGAELNVYSCSLRLDLDGDLIHNLKL